MRHRSLFPGDKEVEEPTKSQGKQFLYIVQASKETDCCKIGITSDLRRRLSEYNNMTGKSKGNQFEYIYACETKDGHRLEAAIKKEFFQLRQQKSREIYFYNEELF
ncbi:MAG: GIY-YIG nuclease family protein, partial [Holophagales bacterium]|nr:GIY-YIG nuclease family protein [Holophagales bacterium]